MIYVEENPRDAKSFTDETSPRKPASSDRKVSIHGQVKKELSLKWFRDLMKLYPGESAEVKSTRILEEFHNLPRDFRDGIWAGMKHVIINIFDSLSYQTNLKQILRDIYKNDKIHELLKQNAKQGDELSKIVLARMDETITKWIIQDSPPERLKREMRPRHAPYSLAFYMRQPVRDDDEVDLTPFRARASSMTGRAVKYASKAGSVFNPAREQINPIVVMYQGEGWTNFMVRQRLRDSHAFDRGDDKSIEWIDSQRRKFNGMGPYYYDDCGTWEDDGTWHACTSESFEEFAYGKLYSIASDKSSYAQAADIAAGFARREYERYGIIAVAGRFEHVTLNGERITQDNAEKKFELWRQLIEREKRESQQIIISSN